MMNSYRTLVTFSVGSLVFYLLILCLSKEKATVPAVSKKPNASVAAHFRNHIVDTIAKYQWHQCDETKNTDYKTAGITSSEFTTYRLHAPNSVGGAVHIIIDAKDERGMQHQHGGDFFTATLSRRIESETEVVSERDHVSYIRTDVVSNSTSGRIVDYNNGTYSVYFVAPWEGQSRVNISLIHSSKAIQFLCDNIWTKFRLFWEGYFQTDSLHGLRKSTICTIAEPNITLRNKDRQVCEYSITKTLKAFKLMCDKPDGGLSCPTITHYSQTLRTERLQSKQLQGIIQDNEYLFKGHMYRSVKTGPETIVLHTDADAASSNANDHSSLHHCEPNNPPSAISSGYWEGNIWRSLQCNNKQFEDPRQIAACLRDRHFYFIGDSTLRQLFHVLCGLLNASCAFTPVDRTPLDLNVPNFSYLPHYNLNLTFIFQSLRNGVSLTEFNMSFLDTDFIDSLGHSHCNYVLGIGVGVHLPQWSRKAFVERLLQLKAATLRLITRCPRVPIFVKLPHMSGPNVELQSDITRSDYLIYSIGLLIRHHLQKTGVFFLDTWDMNLSYPGRNLVHMPYDVIIQELFMALSYVCGNT